MLRVRHVLQGLMKQVTNVDNAPLERHKAYQEKPRVMYVLLEKLQVLDQWLVNLVPKANILAHKQDHALRVRQATIKQIQEKTAVIRVRVVIIKAALHNQHAPNAPTVTKHLLQHQPVVQLVVYAGQEKRKVRAYAFHVKLEAFLPRMD